MQVQFECIVQPKFIMKLPSQTALLFKLKAETALKSHHSNRTIRVAPCGRPELGLELLNTYHDLGGHARFCELRWCGVKR